LDAIKSLARVNTVSVLVDIDCLDIGRPGHVTLAKIDGRMSVLLDMAMTVLVLMLMSLCCCSCQQSRNDADSCESLHPCHYVSKEAVIMIRLVVLYICSTTAGFRQSTFRRPLQITSMGEQ
jgi:hypothetical protein